MMVVVTGVVVCVSVCVYRKEQVSHIITLSGLNGLTQAACSEHKASLSREGSWRQGSHVTTHWVVGSKATVSTLPMTTAPPHIQPVPKEDVWERVGL